MACHISDTYFPEINLVCEHLPNNNNSKQQRQYQMILAQ